MTLFLLYVHDRIVSLAHQLVHLGQHLLNTRRLIGKQTRMHDLLEVVRCRFLDRQSFHHQLL